MNSLTARFTFLRSLLAVAALSLTMLPATAMAQSSTQDGYSGKGPAVQAQIDRGGPGPGNGNDSGTSPSGPSSSATPGSDGGSLPFTGMDLWLLAGAGVLLVGAGAGMRVVMRHPHSAR